MRPFSVRPIFLLTALFLAVVTDTSAQFLPPGGVFRSPKPTPSPSAAKPTPTPAPPALSPDDTTRLQIFLEHENFAPGKLDGKPGEFTRKALARYALSTHRALPPVGPALLAALPAVREVQPYARYTVTADDLAQIGPIPEDRAAQGRLKALPYISLPELLGERFHTSQDFLRQLNPGRSVEHLAAGDAVRVPNVTDPLYVGRGLAVGKDGHALAARPEFRPRVVMVYTKEKMLDVLEDGRLLASFPITPGSTTLPAPPGTWKIETMSSLPFFRYDESMLEHGVRSTEFVHLPPGPNSPVGVMWMGLDRPGIGLHGTNNPDTIGRAASHGCIRLANWDAVKLSQMLTVGVTVHIDGEGKPPAPVSTPTPASTPVRTPAPASKPSPVVIRPL